MKSKDYIHKPKDPVYEAAMMAKWDGLVRRLAVRYGYLGSFDDMAQNGRIGLLYAIRYFDESKGVPFQKVAQLMIRTHMFQAHHREEKLIKGGSEIGCNQCTTMYNIEDCDTMDEESAECAEYDDLLTDEELDAMVLTREEYKRFGHGVGYNKARKAAASKLEENKTKYKL